MIVRDSVPITFFTNQIFMLEQHINIYKCIIIITRIRAIASNSQVTRRVPLCHSNYNFFRRNQSSMTFGFHGNRS